MDEGYKSLYTFKRMLLKFIELQCQWRNFPQIITEYLKCYRHFRKTRRTNFLKKEIEDAEELNKKLKYLEENPIEIEEKLLFTLNEVETEQNIDSKTIEKIQIIIQDALKKSLNFSSYNKDKYLKYKFHKIE